MRNVRIVLGLLFLMLTAGCVQYAGMMQKIVRRALGSDFKGYVFATYPTDNFGVGTAYAPKSGEKADDGNFLCDSEFCLGLDGKLTNAKEWLELEPFVGPGRGGAIALQEEEERKLKGKVILPEVYKLLNASAKGGKSSKTKTTLSLGGATVRKLRVDPFVKHVNSLSSEASALRRAYDNATLVLVVADVVVQDLTVSICVDTKTDAELDAKLAGSVGKVLGTDAALQVAVEQSTAGCYSLKATQPVIVATLTRKRSSGEPQAASDGWENWDVVNVPMPKNRGLRGKT